MTMQCSIIAQFTHPISYQWIFSVVHYYKQCSNYLHHRYIFANLLHSFPVADLLGHRHILFKILYRNVSKLSSRSAMPINIRVCMSISLYPFMSLANCAVEKTIFALLWLQVKLNIFSCLPAILRCISFARVFQSECSSLFSCWFVRTLYSGFLPLPYVLLLR